MILKTYARVFTNDPDGTLAVFQAVSSLAPDMRLSFRGWDLIAIGDVFIVGGTDEALAPIRGSHGPFIVDDLDRTEEVLRAAGAEIVQAAAPAPTGRFLYARHPDGLVIEYTEWTPDLVECWIDAPRRTGRPVPVTPRSEK